MNILRLIRFPVACLATSAVLTGFYIVLFTGLGVERVGYLPHVVTIGICLAFATSVWNELFNVVDNSQNPNISEIIPKSVSMGTGYIIASGLMIVALMLSMTVSLVSFFIVSAFIITSFIFNTVFRKVAILDPVFYALQYTLLLALGMSAHAYLIYLIFDPYIYVPLIFVFLYIAVLRVIRNVSIITVSDEPPVDVNDFEGESLELSTEIDSVYSGRADIERINNFEAAKILGDKINKRNFNAILPEPTVESKVNITEKPAIINGPWVTYSATLTLVVIPVVFCWLYSFEPIQLGLLVVNIVFLLFPVFGVISKKNIDSVIKLFNDGIVSVCFFSSIIIITVSANPMSKQSIVVTVILAGMVLPMLVMKKYFKEIA